MAFSHTVGGMTFTDANFQGNAYADEQTGFPMMLGKMVEHVANAYHGASTDSLTVGAGTKVLTIVNGNGQIPAFSVGMPVRMARTSDPAGVWMQGEITVWDGVSGVATVNVDATKGSGSFSDWSIVIGGHLTIASGTPPLAVSQGGTGASSGKAAFANLTPAAAGVIETNGNFVDAVIFGPALDPVDWSPRTAAPTSSLMLATVENAGADAEVNIWDLTDDALAGAAPLATIVLTGVVAPTSIATQMGYIIVGHEDGIAIIDPHDGSWAERIVGWPRSLSTNTTPSLNDNNIQTVTAGLSDMPVHDPRTDGPMPCFMVSYGSGSKGVSLIKDDGNVWDYTGTVVGRGIGITSDGYLVWDRASGQTSISSARISAITADGWSLDADVMYTGNQFNFGLGNSAGFDLNNKGVAWADTTGLTLGTSLEGRKDGSNLTAIVTRAYASGYMGYNNRGTWLANSKTLDRGYNANDLTENGTVTEAAVDTGAELKCYSGFSGSNYLRRAYDADFDFGTGNFSVSFWMKRNGNSATEYLWARKTSSGSNIFCWVNASAHTIRFFCGDGSNSTDNNSIPYGAGSVWHHIVNAWVGSTGTNRIYIDGVLASELVNASVGNLDNATATFTIGANYDASNPAAETDLSLMRVSKSIPSGAQIRQLYESEKLMFAANAKCLLQSGTTDAVLDVSVDPITGKVAVTQTDSASIWNGLVVESEPVIAPGGANWKHNLLHGNDRVEINEANLYATIAARDVLQDLEILRGLKSGPPPSVDLSKAKMWCYLSGTGTISIKASYNVKSITDNGVGKYQIDFGVSFKSNNYVHFVNGAYNEHLMGGFINAHNLEVRTADSSGTLTDDTWVFVVAFGELENE